MTAENYIRSSCCIRHSTVFKDGQLIFANTEKETAGFLLSLYQFLDLKYARFYKMDNLSKLGWLASEVLLKDNFCAENFQPEEKGIILANANASLDTDLKYARSINDIPSPSVFVYTLPNIMIGEISIRNQCKGETALFVSAQFDAAFMEQYVNNLMNNGILQVCICGWVDLVENDYEAVLFLVENGERNQKQIFSKENMIKTFQTETTLHE